MLNLVKCLRRSRKKGVEELMGKNMIFVFLSARPKRFLLHFYEALKANGITSHLISHKFP